MINAPLALFNEKRARVIAFYFPQYYPFAENDTWWGKGYTEWVSVKKARPFFDGHYQPHVPADLGYYDLRDERVRQAQAQLARTHGIEGFCYWHYWFGGRRVMDRPFTEVLESGKPDFPFCLGWANESWTGIWKGNPRKIHIRQMYPGTDDERKHFYALLPAFRDARYITVQGKPLFVISRPFLIPRSKKFIDHWRMLALEEGLPGLYIVAMVKSFTWNPLTYGFDAALPLNPGMILRNTFGWHRSPNFFLQSIFSLSCMRSFMHQKKALCRDHIIAYEKYVEHSIVEFPKHYPTYPCVVVNWDDTPRKGVNGTVLHNSTPELFRIHFRHALSSVQTQPFQKRIVFLKSWNEWGEGNYLEPDQKFGHGYLKACKDEMQLL